jgi:hypothetical protein
MMELSHLPGFPDTPGAGSGVGRFLPDVEKIGVAGSGYIEAFLVGGAAERGADIFFDIGERGEGDFEREAGAKLIDVAEQLKHDFFVFTVMASGNLKPRDGLESGKRHFKI